MPKPNSVPCVHCGKPTGMFADDGAFIHQSRHSGEIHINELTPEKMLDAIYRSEGGIEIIKDFLHTHGFVLLMDEKREPPVNQRSVN